MTGSTVEVATRAGRHATLTPEQLDDLAFRLDGSLLGEGDEGWENAVLIWNGMAATVPGLVVQPISAVDVAAAVAFAREHGLLVSVKGGGHNIAGTAIAGHGLTLDMSRMREITVDAEARLAHVGPGCRLQDVDRATQAHGLATVLGFVSEVGVAGLTLGGGLGYLTRRFGWAVDNLEAAEIVTADAEIRTASRKENADLFWALRGGGGNFGVVTRFTFRLHEVGPSVYGGLIAWPFERANEILRAYRAITTGAPRELAVWLVLLHAPRAPFVPPDWHGKKICAMAVCYSGDLADTAAVLAPIHSLRDPVFDLLQEQPYTQVQSYLDESEPKGMHYYWKTEYLAELSDSFLSALPDLFATCSIPGGELGFLHLGGALNEHDDDDGAVGNRDARYVCGVKGMWEPDELNADAFRHWITDTWARLRPFSTGRTYINFQTADEGEERVRATYGVNFDRLVDVKKTYDPENLFQSNRNIRPR
jgi:FAD/FMN-containing dehydrogenase